MNAIPTRYACTQFRSRIEARRVSGCYDGNGHKDTDAARPRVKQLWREAGNRVQWRGVGAHP